MALNSPSHGSNDFYLSLKGKLRVGEAKSFTSGCRALTATAKWMPGVSAAPAGSGQTWSLTLLPSTQRDGRIKKCAPESFHDLYLSTRKHKVSGKVTRVTLHSGSTVQTSVLGCVASSPGYNSGCFLRETSQDPRLWNSSPLGWHMEGHSKVK